MKKTALSMALLLSMMAQAQIVVYSGSDYSEPETIDSVRYEVVYDMEMVIDTAKHPTVPISEQMILEVGDRCTHFYSYVTHMADSANLELVHRNTSGSVQLQPGGKVTWHLYRGYPAPDQYANTEWFALDRFVYLQQADEPQWEIQADSTATILGYPCVLATAHYRGRLWSAWYAEDIPISEGPWKLRGLPGLVLRAYDGERHYRFEATAMRQLSGRRPMPWRASRYEQVTEEEFIQIRRRYYADPITYMQGYVNTKVIIRDEHGNDLKKLPSTPFNPIER